MKQKSKNFSGILTVGFSNQNTDTFEVISKKAKGKWEFYFQIVEALKDALRVQDQLSEVSPSCCVKYDGDNAFEVLAYLTQCYENCKSFTGVDVTIDINITNLVGPDMDLIQVENKVLEIRLSPLFQKELKKNFDLPFGEKKI